MFNMFSIDGNLRYNEFINININIVKFYQKQIKGIDFLAFSTFHRKFVNTKVLSLVKQSKVYRIPKSANKHTILNWRYNINVMFASLRSVKQNENQ